jgi:hypothetical protein
VLRIFGSEEEEEEEEEVTEGWKRLHNELHDSYSSLRDGRGMYHALEVRNTKFWFENLKERYHLKNVDVDGDVILEW